MNTVISVKNVGVRYRSRRTFFRHSFFHALRDVSFELYRGESLGIVGRNGVGKTTLLRVLASIIQPDTGTVRRAAASVSMLSLQTGFDPEVTGRQNAVLSGMLLGVPRAQMLDDMEHISEFSGLSTYLDEPIKTYSAGMRIRLGFSIALRVRPDVLLIDEVLGVGDAAFRDRSRRALRERIQSEQTVVLVSHSATEIKTLCDRAVWIENGTSIMQSTAGEVVDAYTAYCQDCHEIGGIGALAA